MTEGGPVELIGYSDRLSVSPGESIGFHVSTRHLRYETALVRLIHGDTRPEGPGFNDVEVPSTLEGERTGGEYGLPSGSYVRVGDAGPLRLAGPFLLEAWVWPSAPDLGSQAILSKGIAYGLWVGDAGDLELRLGERRIGTGTPLRAHTWYRVAAEVDAGSRSARVIQEPQHPWPGVRAAEARADDIEAPAASEAPLLLAACTAGGEVRAHFNGKLDAPRIALIGASGEQTVAAWSLACEAFPSALVRDTGPHGLHGTVVNTPMRAVTGRCWTGNDLDPRHNPRDYSAIWFHDDDLEDAGWPQAFSFTVPDNLRSGVYAARLRAGVAEDYLPFVVRPSREGARSRVVVLLPTLSYLAYGSEHVLQSNPTLPPLDRSLPPAPLDEYAHAHRLRSLYDRHTDGSGVAITSRLRPVTNLRPNYVMPSLGAAHQFNADLHLVDWLEAKDVAADFVTDEDLHHDGAELLSSYQVLVTGSHPEYWTRQMLDALGAYLDAGGRVMYLGGNGLYWVTGIDPGRPHVVEVRRGQRGTGTWRSAVGENHLQTTGELGGLWLERGRPPQRLVGVGMAAQGFDRSIPYRREPGSFDPRASWIFDGVSPDGPIGDYGLTFGGAAGFEIDRMDVDLGTPPHALLLASARSFSDSYQYVVEEVTTSDSRQGGTVNPNVRADMVFFETEAGGAVFSTGSIAWCGSLSYNGYDNDVSRITENVIRAFATGRSFRAESPP